MRFLFLLLVLPAVVVVQAADADWPRWRGPKGDGHWEPKPLPADFASKEPQQLWKVEVGSGFGGVSVHQGRVYLMDRKKEPQEIERLLCFDAKDGHLIWHHEWPVKYGSMGGYATGPRCTVLLHEGYAYAIGATGMAMCLEATTGKVRWQKDTVQALKARMPQWGFAASPVVWKEGVIFHLGAADHGCVISLSQATGDELWRGGDDPAGYSTPEIVTHNGHPLLIQWGPEHIQGLDPNGGKTLWRYPYKITYGVSIAQPLYHDGVLLVSGYWHGAKALRLDEEPKLLWEEERKLCGLMSAPLFKDGLVYLLDKSEGLSCFQLDSGKILWQDHNQLTPADHNPQLSMVWLDKARDLIALLNANGEFIYAKLEKEGAHELARHQLLGKTWAHPGFTSNTVFARSDKELSAWRLWP